MDYYPFGMLMPGRHTNTGDYRYGYNGIELDNEVKGEGNTYTTEFRQYDPRVARWLSLDPLSYKYPHQSPYVAMDNNPINVIDPSGLMGEDPPTKGAVVQANEIAKGAIETIGNNAKKRSFGARVASSLIGIEGTEAQHQRGVQVENFIANEVGKVYDEGTAEYAELYNLSVDFYEEGSYLSATQPKAYEEYNSLLAEYCSIEDKFLIIASRSTHIYSDNQKYQMSGLILTAYAAAFPGGGLGGNVTNKTFSYIPRYVNSKGASELVTVGRWMSQTEFTLMQKSGNVVESVTGTTHVTYPANPEAFTPANPAKSPLFVTFKVPKAALRATNAAENKAWSKILSPNSLEGRLAKIKGNPIPELPKAVDIKIIKSNIKK